VKLHGTITPGGALDAAAVSCIAAFPTRSQAQIQD
jgi:hypothetical protein